MDFFLKTGINPGISACNFGAKFRRNRAGWDRMDALTRAGVRDSMFFRRFCTE